ncbi:MAG: DUF433 domain-containing protein [Elusimicrobiota bacterium]
METLIKTEHPYIVRKSGVCGGSPIIEGSRITVRLIAQFVKTGSTAEEILASYHIFLSHRFMIQLATTLTMGKKSSKTLRIIRSRIS